MTMCRRHLVKVLLCITFFLSTINGRATIEHRADNMEKEQQIGSPLYNQVQVMYKSLFNRDNLLLTRRALQLFMRKCNFLLKYLPEPSNTKLVVVEQVNFSGLEKLINAGDLYTARPKIAVENVVHEEGRAKRAALFLPALIYKPLRRKSVGIRLGVHWRPFYSSYVTSSDFDSDYDSSLRLEKRRRFKRELPAQHRQANDADADGSLDVTIDGVQEHIPGMSIIYPSGYTQKAMAVLKIHKQAVLERQEAALNETKSEDLETTSRDDNIELAANQTGEHLNLNQITKESSENGLFINLRNDPKIVVTIPHYKRLRNINETIANVVKNIKAKKEVAHHADAPKYVFVVLRKRSIRNNRNRRQRVRRFVTPHTFDSAISHFRRIAPSFEGFQDSKPHFNIPTYRRPDYNQARHQNGERNQHTHELHEHNLKNHNQNEKDDLKGDSSDYKDVTNVKMNTDLDKLGTDTKSVEKFANFHNQQTQFDLDGTESRRVEIMQPSSSSSSSSSIHEPYEENSFNFLPFYERNALFLERFHEERTPSTTVLPTTTSANVIDDSIVPFKHLPHYDKYEEFHTKKQRGDVLDETLTSPNAYLIPTKSISEKRLLLDDRIDPDLIDWLIQQQFGKRLFKVNRANNANEDDKNLPLDYENVLFYDKQPHTVYNSYGVPIVRKRK